MRHSGLGTGGEGHAIGEDTKLAGDCRAGCCASGDEVLDVMLIGGGEFQGIVECVFRERDCQGWTLTTGLDA